MKLKPVKKVEEKKQEKLNPKVIFASYLDNIEHDLEIQGAVFFDENHLDIDSEHLSLPREITEAYSKELGEYLNAFTQQKIYMRTILGRVSVVLEEKKRAYIEASKSLYRKYSLDTKMSETAKERIITSDDSVKSVYYEYVDYQKKYDILELNISNIEDSIFMISREISRRTGDFNDENRNHNVGRR